MGEKSRKNYTNCIFLNRGGNYVIYEIATPSLRSLAMTDTLDEIATTSLRSVSQ